MKIIFFFILLRSVNSIESLWGAQVLLHARDNEVVQPNLTSLAKVFREKIQLLKSANEVKFLYVKCLGKFLYNNNYNSHLPNVVLIRHKQQVELVILVDGSDSVGQNNFLSEIKFIQKVISDVKVGPKDFRLGIVIYGTKAVRIL